MKRTIAMIITVILVASAALLISCGKTDKIEPPDNTEQDQTTVSAEKQVEKKAADEPKELPEATRPYTISGWGIGGGEDGSIVLSTSVGESSNSSETEIPDEAFLYDFLIRYELFSGAEYDAENPSESLIMMSIASDSLINETVYEFGRIKTYTEESDPRGWAWLGTFISDRETVDWLASNIFNLSEDGIAQAVNAAEEKKQLYAEGDKYYGVNMRTGVGLMPAVVVKECIKDGDVYWLGLEYDYDGKKDIRYAKTEYKMIDGVGYWTLHTFSENRPEEMPER